MKIIITFAPMKKKAPKQRVMETAKKLFQKQGFNSTGINQIIKESGVAKASFYDHFPSKNDLALEYLNQRHLSWFEGLKSFIEKEASPTGKIIQSFEYLKYMNEKEDFSGCVFLNMLAELKSENTKAHTIIKNHKTDLQNFFKEIITEEDKAFLIYMLFESCLVESQVYQSQNQIDKTIQIIQNNIL